MSDKNGLPEVADLATRRYTLVLLLLGLVCIGFIGIYHHTTTSNEETEKPLEETYTMAVATQEEPPKEVVVPALPKPITEAEVAMIQEKQKELQQRLSAPLMIVNQGTDKEIESKTKAEVKDPNLQFMQQVASQNNEVSTIAPLDAVIGEGSFIHAIMESATNSDLPGFLRATVSERVYSEDGSRVLVPVGSRLIGQYKSGMLQGQSRIFIVWTRLITPEGLSVSLGSAGVDSLGVTGIGADEVNRHFWERFGTASLLSLIGAGTSNLGVSGGDQANSIASFRESLATSFNQSANQSLQQDSTIAPTLETYQGKPILVFVAHDLHFGEILQKQNISIF